MDFSQVRWHGGLAEEQHVERQTRICGVHVDIHSVRTGSCGCVARPIGSQVCHDEHGGRETGWGWGVTSNDDNSYSKQLKI